MKLRKIIPVLVLILAIFSIIGCGGGEAKAGDKVSVHYTGTLDDGSVFDTSRDGDNPIQFVLGGGNMIPGFEKAVRGMKVGEIKTVTLSPEEAYGEYRQDLVFTFSWAEVPEGIEVEIDQKMPLESDQGDVIIATVTDISEESITMDANHQLAGKRLTFEIELVKIEPAE